MKAKVVRKRRMRADPDFPLATYAITTSAGARLQMFLWDDGDVSILAHGQQVAAVIELPRLRAVVRDMQKFQNK